jgi:hypothetical protein
MTISRGEPPRDGRRGDSACPPDRRLRGRFGRASARIASASSRRPSARSAAAFNAKVIRVQLVEVVEKLERCLRDLPSWSRIRGGAPSSSHRKRPVGK